MDTNQTFITTATSNGTTFFNFGIKESENEIFDLTFTISPDQSLPARNDKSLLPDYWAWYDNEVENFTIIKSKKKLLNMCFPYGIAKDEEAGIGKAYRIIVKEKGTN